MNDNFNNNIDKNKNEKGFVLPLALWLVAIIVALSLVFVYSMKTEFDMGHIYKADIQGHYYAEGGIYKAIGEIIKSRTLSSSNILGKVILNEVMARAAAAAAGSGKKAKVIFTEIMADVGNEDTDEFVELFNAGDANADLAYINLNNCYKFVNVTDVEAAILTKYFDNGTGTTPAGYDHGTILQPGQYALYLDSEYTIGTKPYGDPPAANIVLLAERTALGALTSGLCGGASAGIDDPPDNYELHKIENGNDTVLDYIPGVSFGAAPLNQSALRKNDTATYDHGNLASSWNFWVSTDGVGDGPYDTVASQVSTTGDNPDDAGEYVEIFNFSDANVDVANYTIEHTTKDSSGSDTTAIGTITGTGEGTTLPPFGYGVIVSPTYDGRYDSILNEVNGATAIKLNADNFWGVRIGGEDQGGGEENMYVDEVTLKNASSAELDKVKLPFGSASAAGTLIGTNKHIQGDFNTSWERMGLNGSVSEWGQSNMSDATIDIKGTPGLLNATISDDAHATNDMVVFEYFTTGYLKGYTETFYDGSDSIGDYNVRVRDELSKINFNSYYTGLSSGNKYLKSFYNKVPGRSWKLRDSIDDAIPTPVNGTASMLKRPYDTIEELELISGFTISSGIGDVESDTLTVYPVPTGSALTLKMPTPININTTLKGIIQGWVDSILGTTGSTIANDIWNHIVGADGLPGTSDDNPFDGKSSSGTALTSTDPEGYTNYIGAMGEFVDFIKSLSIAPTDKEKLILTALCGNSGAGTGAPPICFGPYFGVFTYKGLNADFIKYYIPYSFYELVSRGSAIITDQDFIYKYVRAVASVSYLKDDNPRYRIWYWREMWENLWE